MDDGNTQTGNVRAMQQVDGQGAATGTATNITAQVEAAASDLYTVCVAF